MKSYVDMTIHTIDPARVVAKMCHYKLPSYLYNHRDHANTLMPPSLFSG